ncbi:hypothetical protein [Govanella unica]|uniref:Lysylphosphatidylglycerol synthase TM region n=1 Tax=Govanella unica TaxID=2975056 RepID=A0A9X3Z7L8_9PROT|nr:hypothetical protein [Govania unica]MDA5194193.1 hypothetical protein [Govania unica]
MVEVKSKLQTLGVKLAPIGRKLALPVQGLVLAAVVYFMISRLSDYSWHEIFLSLPRSGWFYGFFVCLYITPPLADFLLYRWLFRLNAGSLPVMFYKRACNEGFFDYSGEAFFYFWVKKKSELTGARIFDAVKNVNILSALSSNVMTLAILAVAATGQVVGISTLYEQIGLKTILLLGVVVIGLLVLLIGTRSSMQAMTWREAMIICMAHCLRITAVMVLQIAMWSSLFPDISFKVWAIFLAAQMVLGRVPFLPNKDLLFTGLAIGLAPHVLSSQLSVLGMFMTAATLTVLCHLTICIVGTIMNGAAGLQGNLLKGWFQSADSNLS